MLTAGAFRRQYMGGARSWLRLALRVLIVSALIVVVLLGTRDLARSLLPSGRAGGASNASGAGAFPQASAAAFATRFALAYMSYDSGQPDARQRALTPYLADDVDSSAGWDGQGKQTAVAAVVSAIKVLDTHRALVSIAVLVNGGRWVYLAVPVVADGNALVVADAPSLIPPPARASWKPMTDTAEQDSTLSVQLRPSLVAFFRAYAGSTNELSYFTAPDVHIEGLGGAVQLDDLAQLSVAQGGADQRSATAAVRWLDPITGAGLTQRYRLQLVRTADRWLVAAVAPAADGGA
jgi:hypothetical protein